MHSKNKRWRGGVWPLLASLLLLFLTACSAAVNTSAQGLQTATPTHGEAAVTPTTTPDLCKSAVPAAGQGTIQVTTSPACTQVTSQFASGITLSDNTLAYPWANNNLAAVNNVKGLIKNGIHYQNTPIMGWGLDDPWPDPNSAEPTAWSGLDARLRLAVDTGATP